MRQNSLHSGGAKPKLAILPTNTEGKSTALLDWSNMKLTNADCVTYFVARYLNVDKYKSEKEAVPANTTNLMFTVTEGFVCHT